MSAKLSLFQLALLTLGGSVLGQQVNGENYDSPDGGPPADYFAADSSLAVDKILSAVSKLSQVGDSYPITTESDKESQIFSDWASFDDGAAIVFTADMDVDCDGLDHECDGNPDGQPQTNWGSLAAYEVPFIVIPDEYLTNNEETLSGNNIAAVIWYESLQLVIRASEWISDGKMFYGILGDSNGDEPQVTGEASWLMARTCFPNDNLAGDKGHTESDVTYILFLGDKSVLPGDVVDENYISDFGKLKSMGDDLMNSLLSNIGLNSDAPTNPTSTSTTTTTTTTTTPTPTGGNCSWPGHCEGASCSSDDDCGDDLACNDGSCSPP